MSSKVEADDAPAASGAFQPPRGFEAAGAWQTGLPAEAFAADAGQELWLVQLPQSVRAPAAAAPRSVRLPVLPFVCGCPPELRARRVRGSPQPPPPALHY